MKIEIYLWLYHLRICIKYVVKFSKLVIYETDWKEFCLKVLYKIVQRITLYYMFLGRIQSVPITKSINEYPKSVYNKKALKNQCLLSRHTLNILKSGHSVSNFKSWASIFGLKLLRNCFGAIELASHQVWSCRSGKPAKSKRRSQLLARMSHSKFL